MVAVVAFSVVATLMGAVIVQTVIQSGPLMRSTAVEVYAHRAAEAGQNAYLTAINFNPTLAQCNTNTNGTRMCSGINYGQWNFLDGSDAPGSDKQYYAFGNPQMTFDPTTHELTNLSVEVVGAAYDTSAANHYRFVPQTINVAPTNGFLKNLWWSNYESYSSTGDYSSCNYNWNLGYNILNRNVGCGPVYFGPSDYLFGPVYTNDSVFVSGDGSVSNSPSFGNVAPPPPATAPIPSQVTTADPNCLFVDNNHGMGGSSSNCAAANSDVATYDPANSSHGHAVEQPPANDTQLNFIAAQYGCLYSGPTQITLSTDAGGHGQMTVVSPDTSEGTQTVNGVQHTWDTNNIPSNVNNCPNNGTAPLPDNGVVFVQNATPAQTQAWANPFDDATNNSSSNLTSVPAAPLQANKVQPVTLTATVTSGSSHLDAGATVAFSQTTRFFFTTTTVINSCSAQPLSTPVAVSPPTTPPTYKSTATCATNESSTSTGAFSSAYSGGPSTTSSSANLGQTNTLSPAISYGPDAQVTAGGCTNCYFGQTASPDAEGDAFVNGSLSGQLTIGTANNVIIDGNITYADCASTWTAGQSGLSAPSMGLCPFSPGGTNDALGLIANNYVELNRPLVASSTQGNGGGPTIEPPCGATPAATCDPSNGTNGVTIDAAVLALTQAFVVNNYNVGGTEGNLTVYGSIQQFARGPVGTFGGSPTGYVKAYTWDPLLDFVSPPSYLVPSTPSWVLGSVDTNAGVGSGGTCPPLPGVYAGTINGVIQDGPPITQYCSIPPGNLPDFPAMTAPSAPTNVTATSNTDGSVTLNWHDPVSDNGSPITGYGVAPSPTCSGCSYSSLVGPTVTSTTVTGLTRGTWYTFSVTATNLKGNSNPSTASNSVIAPDVPSAPTNVSATTNPDGTVTVSWTDPAANGSPITRYSIVPNPSCSGCSYTSLTGPTLTSGTVSGLTRGATYTFTVTATNGVGTGPASAPSNSVTAPNVPGAPNGVTATPGNGTASVSWTAPSNGGSPITAYVVTPYIGAGAQTPQTFVSTTTTQTVTGLANGTAYTFKVAATNGVGTGTQSSASGSVTPATVPGAPTGVSGFLIALTTTVTLSWTAPVSNGGSAITGYVVTPYKNGIAQAPQTFNSTATTENVTGLSHLTTYTFKVAAINIAGTGPNSTASGLIVVV